MNRRDKSADPHNVPLYSSSIVNNFHIHNNTNNVISSSNTNIITNQQNSNTNISQSEGENTQSKVLTNLIDSLNLNKGIYLNDESSLVFKRKIDKLNLRFYMETERYLSNKKDITKCQDALFIILFKQISLYMQELERCNSLIREYRNEILTRKETPISLGSKNNTTNFKTTTAASIVSTSNINTNEVNKLKIENESLKRQIDFYKDKLQLHVKQSNSKGLACSNCKSTLDYDKKTGESRVYLTSSSVNTNNSGNVNIINIATQGNDQSIGTIKSNLSIKNFKSKPTSKQGETLTSTPITDEKENTRETNKTQDMESPSSGNLMTVFNIREEGKKEKSEKSLNTVKKNTSIAIVS